MSDLIRPVGPVDILVVGFPENRFDGSIAPAIADLVEPVLGKPDHQDVDRPDRSIRSLMAAPSH